MLLPFLLAFFIPHLFVFSLLQDFERHRTDLNAVFVVSSRRLLKSSLDCAQSCNVDVCWGFYQADRYCWHLKNPRKVKLNSETSRSEPYIRFIWLSQYPDYCPQTLNFSSSWRSSRYKVLLHQKKWKDAMRECRKLGLRLAIITSQFELKFLTSFSAKLGVELFVGAHNHTGTWKWITGQLANQTWLWEDQNDVSKRKKHVRASGWSVAGLYKKGMFVENPNQPLAALCECYSVAKWI